MREFGLIGKTLTHSFSEKYFSEKFRQQQIFDASYSLFPLQSINELNPLIRSHPNLLGLNVTIPYKIDIIPLLNELDTEAQKIGAVNCIKITHENNRIYLKGYNTDIYGFRSSLLKHLKPHHTHALILGTGGASKAVEYVLKSLSIEYIAVSRKANTANKIVDYNMLNEHIIQNNTLIINTTPLGMFPNNNTYPNIPYNSIGDKHLLMDLVYHPNETVFLTKGKQNGAATVNGYNMLISQAEASWDIWSK